MILFGNLIFISYYSVFSFRFCLKTHTPFLPLKSQSFHDSMIRDPIPGEHIVLPKVNQATGEYLLDRPLIEKVASLRTFIETIEINRGKILTDSSFQLDEKEVSNDNQGDSDSKGQVEINEENLEPVWDLLAEEDLLEEVLSNAFATYRKENDIESIERLENISEQIVPIATKLRKDKSELNITRLIGCYMNGEENLDKVLEELQEKKALDKYLITRLDELINLASKKYRISENHPAVSEEFLRILKDRIAAQRITHIRGTDLFVKTLALCFQSEEKEDWNQRIKENIRSIEDLEEFHEWIVDGIEYCRSNNKLGDKVEKMEKILDVVVRQHPIWNPREDHIEYEETGNEEYKPDPEIAEKLNKLFGK